MYIYLSFFLLVLFCIYYVESFSKGLTTRSQYFLYMLFSFPILGSLAAFRYDVGVDYKEYESIFDLVRFHNHTVEPFINFTVYFFSFFTTSNIPVFATLAFPTVFLFLDFIIKNSKSIFISYCIFLCFGGFYLGIFNHSRQFLAVSIFLYSLKYINSSSLKSYCICILIATLVHYSAIVMLPMYFVFKLKFNIKNVLLLTFFYFLALTFSEIFIKLTPYGIYLDRVVENERNLYLTIGFIFIAIFYVLIGLKDAKNSKDSIFLYMSLFSGLLLISTFLSSIPWNLFFRLNGYFTPFVIIFFGYLHLRIMKISQSLSFLYKMLFLVFSFLYLYNSLAFKGVDYHLIPYNTVL